MSEESKRPVSTNFRIKKRQVAAYFNNGHSSQTVWNADYEKGLACKKLVDAVNAGRDAFNKIWLAKDKS